MTVAYRAADLADPEDRMFVISTWAASFKKSYSAGLITSEDWATVMHAQLGKILDRSGARAVIAVESTDPTFFYGWIAGDTSERVPVVYYVYVKEPYRRAGYENGVRVGDGYARQLFDAFGIDLLAPFTYVCDTPAVSRLRDKFPRARRNPLEVRYPKETRRHR